MEIVRSGANRNRRDLKVSGFTMKGTKDTKTFRVASFRDVFCASRQTGPRDGRDEPA